jgi:hypothetical protein
MSNCNNDNKITIRRYDTGTICASIYGLSDYTGMSSTFNVSNELDGTLDLMRDCSILPTADPSIYVLAYHIGLYDISMNAGSYLYSYVLESSSARYTPLQEQFTVLPSVKYGSTKKI